MPTAEESAQADKDDLAATKVADTRGRPLPFEGLSTSALSSYRRNSFKMRLPTSVLASRLPWKTNGTRSVARVTVGSPGRSKFRS